MTEETIDARPDAKGAETDIEGRLSERMARAAQTPLTTAVREKTKAHLLDTLAAMISGASLRAGRLAIAYLSEDEPRGAASIAGARMTARSGDAAFVNAMSAHADESDDSHLEGKFHPGCGVVPAALALAEERDVSCGALLRAIALGYDYGARFTKALGMTTPRSWTHSTHCIGANFGAAAAAGALAGLSAPQCRSLLAYAVQQASGIPIWHRDAEHVQKAYDFGARAARDGVFAARFVALGATGAADAISGQYGYLSAFAQKARPEELLDRLEQADAILKASIKKWTVGSPIQAALDALEELMRAHDLAADEVASLNVILPDDRFAIVDDREMPDICAQHCLAVLLLDGALPFASAHDAQRMSDPAVRALRARIRMTPSPELTVARPERQAIVEIETISGAQLRHHAQAVLGTPEKPMSWDQSAAKARDLILPALGSERAEELITFVAAIDDAASSRRLGALTRLG